MNGDALEVLVVDDDYRVASVHVAFVEGVPGFRVVGQAHTAADALELAQKLHPDLVLLDIMMPQMDGWEVLKLLRVDEETAEIPVAMLSARTEARDRVQGLQEGAIDYICKPFSLQELLGKIEAIFQNAAR